MAAVFANLKSVFEFALEQMGLATVAFDEDVFSLYDTFFRGDRFYALCFLIEPGHKNGGKGSTKTTDSELDTLLGPNSRGKWMFDLCHLSHEVGGFDQFRWGVAACNHDV